MPVKQDIRQGTWHLMKKNETRSRPSRHRDREVDLSSVDSSIVDGMGYTFGEDMGSRHECFGDNQRLFHDLCRAKRVSFQDLLFDQLIRMPASLGRESFALLKKATGNA